MEAGSTLTSHSDKRPPDPALATNLANCRQVFLHSSDAQPTLVLRAGPTISSADPKPATKMETEMTAIIALNVVFAAAVITGIVGMLARSIAKQESERRAA
jgi:hypothetical protein